MAVSPSAPLKGSSIRHQKSRLGCKTCKIRRVKCGEEKPSCLRCTSTGRKCEYERQIICYTASSSIVDKPLSLYANTVWRERRAFAYYFQHAAASVGGGLDADFWHAIVPQVCRNEPAVWDAMISISALFESPEPYPDLICLPRAQSRTLNQNQRDALDWYARSVSAVRRGIERGGVDGFVGLITCVLFICIEVLLGNMEEAMHLYSQGVHLILTLQTRESCETMSVAEISLLKDTIIPIFIRLGAVSPAAGAQVDALMRGSEHSFTQEFSSLKSARETIVTLTAEIHFFEFTCEEYLMKSLADHISHELMNRREALLAKLQSWHTAFTNLMMSLCKKDVLPPLQLSTGAVLLAYYEMLSVILAVCASPSRITTDACILNFENIIEQARISFSGSTRYDGTQPPFTFELGIGFPLWFTCIRCRDPAIRRIALDMLSQGHQAQGLNKREHGTIVCQAIMNLEETYGMFINGSQPMTPPQENKPPPIEYQSYCQDISNPSSPFSMDSEIAEIASLSLTEIETAIPTAPMLVVPEGARVKPLGVFRPRDGYPPQATEQDVAKWSRSHDQVFLQFSRNIYNRSNNTWETIYGCVPVDLM